MKFLGFLGLTLLLSLTGCGQSRFSSENTYLNNKQVIILSKKDDSLQPANSAEFLSAIAKHRVSKENIELIVEFTRVKPTGKWIEFDGNNPEQNLTLHFQKHRYDFNPPFRTEEEYHNSAVKAAASNDPNYDYFFDLKYYNEGMVSVVKWNAKSKELVVMRSDGRLATYFSDDRLASGRFIKIPKDMIKRDVK